MHEFNNSLDYTAYSRLLYMMCSLTGVLLCSLFTPNMQIRLAVRTYYNRSKLFPRIGGGGGLRHNLLRQHCLFTSRSAMILFLSSVVSSWALISTAVALSCCSFKVRLPGDGKKCKTKTKTKNKSNSTETGVFAFIHTLQLTVVETRRLYVKYTYICIYTKIYIYQCVSW